MRDNGDAPSAAMECDVAVVGGGPAGIAAATRAAEHGARVIVLDQGLAPGGQIWRHHDPRHLPRAARRWMERCERSGARWLSEAAVVDGATERGLAVVRRDAAFRVYPRAVVIATGARELFLPFPGWTLPNVMGMGGAQALIKGGADVSGRRVVVAGSGPLVLPVAAAMARGGATLVAVAEQAPLRSVAGFATALWAHPSKLAQAAHYRGAFARRSYHCGTWVLRADGDGRVQQVTLTDGRGRRRVEACDLLCCSFGLVPNTELATLLGCTVVDGTVRTDSVQRTSVPNVFCAGEPTGVGGEQAALVEGEIAGLAASGHEDAARAVSLQRARDDWKRFSTRLASAFHPREELLTLADGDTIVCRCEDVRYHRLNAAWSVRQAKMYTRIGMGPCQGAVCGAACQVLFGWERGTVRPPLGAPRVEAWMETSAQERPSSATA
ncbi:MAG TPA: FAD-dependent oxidoreductase [Gemmatimonadaceae bacterium]|nr:FAD-dependent oxidoreductase [Gemmatimonadaceae bacterium]